MSGKPSKKERKLILDLCRFQFAKVLLWEWGWDVNGLEMSLGLWIGLGLVVWGMQEFDFPRETSSKHPHTGP